MSTLSIQLDQTVNEARRGAGLLAGLNPVPQDKGAGVDANAFMVADFAGNRYRIGNVSYATKAEWLAAIGGVESSGQTIGPYVAPDAPELLTNGDFSDGANGWAAYNSGLLSVSGGEGILDANNGTSPGFSRPVTTALGKAYRIAVAYRRLTGAITFGALAGGSGAALGGGAATVSTGATTGVTFNGVSYFGGEPTQYVGSRAFSASGAGTAAFDNFSVKEASPFAGWRTDGFSARIKARTPAAVGAGDKVLLQADQNAVFNGDGTPRNRVRVYWDNTKKLQVLVNYGGAVVAQLDLGVVEPNTDFDLLLSLATNSFRAVLVGQTPVQVDTAGTMPGVAALRIGRTFAGEIWDGTVGSVVLSPALSEAEFYASSLSALLMAMWGDSLTAGANATTDNARPPQAGGLLFTPKRTIVNLGLGGQTSTQIAARLNAQPLTVTVTGNQIPASGSIAVTAKNINILTNSGNFTGSQTGTLAGVKGTMTTDASGNWSFARTTPGDAVACPAGSVFTCDLGVVLRSQTSWLWPGRNGAQSGYTVEGDIAAMVAYLGHDRYLVGSTLTSTADSAGGISQIEARNATLSSLYGTRYVDVLGALKAANDGSANDLADIAAGYVPRSLRSDAVHLNDAGYAIVASSFKARHDAVGLG